MRKKRQKRRDIDSLLIFYYSKILRKKAKSFLFLPLADMYRRKGMPELSVQICLRGLKVHPDYMSARMLLGLSYYDCERLDDAERELRVVADSVADNILARRVLSDIYRKKGKIDDALKEIEAIISIAPNNKNFQVIREGLQKLLIYYQEAVKPDAAPEPEIQTKKSKLQIVRIPDEMSSKETDAFENLLDDDEAFEEIERLFPSKIENLSGNVSQQINVTGNINSDVKIDAVKILNGWLKNIEKK
ncbi:MAG: hypothetical protein HY096_12510 [Nitrospinae bacterium]|nr:hypothetical protein [Nitrospinota bacterium]